MNAPPVHENEQDGAGNQIVGGKAKERVEELLEFVVRHLAGRHDELVVRLADVAVDGHVVGRVA